MKFLVLGIGPGLVLAGIAEETPNLSWLRDFGIAAPFAALCFWMVLQTRKDHKDANTAHVTEMATRQSEHHGDLDKKDAEIARLHAKVEELQREALQREQQLVAGLGPRIYDAARLFHEGNKQLAEQVTAPPLPPAAPAGVDRRLDELTELVERLVSGMGRGDAHDDDRGPV